MTWFEVLALIVSMLVGLPLALRLLAGDGGPGATWALAWLPVALTGAISLALGRGAIAAGMSLVYTGACVALSLLALATFLAARTVGWARRSGVAAVLITPLPAGVSLFLDRADSQVAGMGGHWLSVACAAQLPVLLVVLSVLLVDHVESSRVTKAMCHLMLTGVILCLAAFFTGLVHDWISLLLVAGCAALSAGAVVSGYLLVSRVARLTERPAVANLLRLNGITLIVIAVTAPVALWRLPAGDGWVAPWAVLLSAALLCLCSMPAWLRLLQLELVPRRRVA